MQVPGLQQPVLGLALGWELAPDGLLPVPAPGLAPVLGGLLPVPEPGLAPVPGGRLEAEPVRAPARDCWSAPARCGSAAPVRSPLAGLGPGE